MCSIWVDTWRMRKGQLFKDFRKSITDRGNSRYKGPEVRMSLTYSRNSKKASVTRVGEVRGKEARGEATEMGRSLYEHMFLFLSGKCLLLQNCWIYA